METTLIVYLYNSAPFLSLHCTRLHAPVARELLVAEHTASMKSGVFSLFLLLLQHLLLWKIVRQQE